jgi:hypothetical protein
MTERDTEPDEVRLDTLPREIEPPPGSSNRIAARLAQEGLIRQSKPPSRRWLRVAALLVVGFAAGWGAARTTSPAPPEATGDRYILLLYGAPASDPAGRAIEYRDWAARTRQEGRHVSGERLGTSFATLGPGGKEGKSEKSLGAPLGYFIVEAGSEDEAASVAASHPHIRHGGTIVVRRINPT